MAGLTKISHEASLEPAIDSLQFATLCIILAISDDKHKSVNQMFQGQAISVDNVLAFCNNQSSFKALSKTKVLIR